MTTTARDVHGYTPNGPRILDREIICDVELANHAAFSAPQTDWGGPVSERYKSLGNGTDHHLIFSLSEANVCPYVSHRKPKQNRRGVPNPDVSTQMRVLRHIDQLPCLPLKWNEKPARNQ